MRALAEITGQQRLMVYKKVYFSFRWNFFEQAGLFVRRPITGARNSF